MADSQTPVAEPRPRKGLFDLKGNQTNWKREVLGGLTTFFAMSYIIAVNPSILSQSGIEWGAVFIATCISSIIGTLIMGLVANVPYAQAPGMGLNAFFTFTICLALNFTWQQALSMVFICGLINVLITVTKVRKMIIKAIPESLQNAISGGIGIFLIYLGLLNVGFINFSSGVPAMSMVDSATLGVFVFGLILCILLNVLKVPGAMIISIIATTLFGMIPFNGVPGSAAQVTNTTASMIDFVSAFKALPGTFGVIFTHAGLGSLFSGNATEVILVLISIFAFSMSDTFDTIGTFIGTGRRSGIFSDSDMKSLEAGKGFKSKMDRALFADSTATSIGALFGTSNTTTFVESAAGIGAGAKTGLASVVTALCFFVSIFLAGPVSAIPMAATAPCLIVVGCMMLANFSEIHWTKLEEAIPAMFAGVFMALCYSISYGIAMGFISYCLIQFAIYFKDLIVIRRVLAKGEGKRQSNGSVLKNDGTVLEKPTTGVSVILGVATLLFLLNFILQALPIFRG